MLLMLLFVCNKNFGDHLCFCFIKCFHSIGFIVCVVFIFCLNVKVNDKS